MNHFHEIENNNYLSSLVKDDNVEINNFEKIFNNYYINCEFQIILI